MDKLIRTVLAHVVQRGTLDVTTSGGTRFRVGDGSGTPLGLRLLTPRAGRGLVLDPYLRLGEAYMDGELTVEGGDIYDLLALLMSNLHGRRPPASARMLDKVRFAARRVRQFNPAQRARRNVAHHYDLDGRLYSLFLDSDRQYSCAYFEHPDDSLEDAQLAKKRHIAAKLLVEPGMRVLDIGSGWGGLGLYLAERARAEVLGVTLSEEQLALSRGRAEERGLAGRVRFELQDYRALQGRFDRIVSVGMFEHVGVVHYQDYFEACARLLADDGVMLLHSIGRSEGPGATNPWIDRYIFPGGYIPALSEVLPVIERCGLLVNDVEILRLHYAETLKAWRARFMARRDEAEALYDERFCRMWEFYLAASEASFRFDDLMVFQIQLSKRQGIVPMTRGYIAEREAALREREAERVPLRLAGE